MRTWFSAAISKKGRQAFQGEIYINICVFVCSTFVPSFMLLKKSQFIHMPAGLAKSTSSCRLTYFRYLLVSVGFPEVATI